MLNYTILLFYMTVEAVTGGILGKKILFKNSCFEICLVKIIINTFKEVSFSVKLQACDRFQWLLTDYKRKEI